MDKYLVKAIRIEGTKSVYRQLEEMISSLLSLRRKCKGYFLSGLNNPHGEVIQHASFDTSLWTDMIPKMILDYP